MATPLITPFDNSLHRTAVIALWQTVFGYESAHNDPSLAIDKKVTIDDGLFFIALFDAEIAGTIMAGYDGHRGWLYALAVLPQYRNRDIGAALVRHAEQALTSRGCMKINLQILQDNSAVQSFYTSLGYAVEPRISMGKHISENIP